MEQEYKSVNDHAFFVGDIFFNTFGEYANFSIDTHYRVLKPFVLSEAIEASRPDTDRSHSMLRVYDYLVAENIIEKIFVLELWELEDEDQPKVAMWVPTQRETQ